MVLEQVHRIDSWLQSGRISMPLKRYTAAVIISGLLLFSWYTNSPGWEQAPFPRLANVYLAKSITESEADILSRWNILVLHYALDNTQEQRDMLRSIKRRNPGITFLIYISSIETDVTEEPPGKMEEACDKNDWWLRDDEGNYLYNPSKPWRMLINMTNTEAAGGKHPEERKANEFLAEHVIRDHLSPYGYWDGIFYDSFSDNLAWMFRDRKDADRNGIPEFDAEENGNEPIFSHLWADGMLSLLENTIALRQDVIIVGNGQYRDAVENLNGCFYESFSKTGSENIHSICSTPRLYTEDMRTPRVSIVNGKIKDTDPTRYRDMRFTLCATLMTNNYYSGDFGRRHHEETLWYDEYSVRPDGRADALSTILSADIDRMQNILPVRSTAGFQPSGILEIEGEQIYYGSKDETHFMDCRRGFPRKNKYDLRKSHETGATVVQHSADHTGYLGRPLGDAFDADDNGLRLADILRSANWILEEDEIEIVNSTVWRRNFENGTVLVNPTEGTVLVEGLGKNTYRRIEGFQDPLHNNGSVLCDTLRIAPGDGYILVRTPAADTAPQCPAPRVR